MKKVIVITGTPGSGKTTIAIELSRRLDRSQLISVNQVVKEKRLFSSYSKDGARIVKLNGLRKELERRISASKTTVILDGHLLCEMRIKGATAIVIREHLSILKSRLLKRGYSIGKTRDNIVSEAIDYCGEKARQNYPKTFEMLSGKNATTSILKIINGKRSEGPYIDMLRELPDLIKKDKRFAIG
jgi:adenylate kinase